MSKAKTMSVTEATRRQAREQLTCWLKAKSVPEYKRSQKSKLRKSALTLVEPDEIVQLFRLVAGRTAEVIEIVNYVKTHKVLSLHLESKDIEAVRALLIVAEVMES